MAQLPRVRIYFKKKIEIGHLSFDQTAMLKLGNVGLASRKNEIAQAQNAQGGPAKPLSKGYAIYKSRFTKKHFGYGRNKRDLSLTGRLMAGFLIRTVSDNQAVASWSTLDNREKARANNLKEEFISWSPNNVNGIVKASEILLGEELKKFVVERGL